MHLLLGTSYLLGYLTYNLPIYVNNVKTIQVHLMQYACLKTFHEN
jgi:hypothetical protein